MQRIIRYICFSFIGIALLGAPSARAQDMNEAVSSSLFAPEQSATRPSVTPPQTVAMLFYRLAGTFPNFDAWVRQSDEMKNATPFDQANILEKETDRLKQAFIDIAVRDPIVVEMQAKLSDYNAKNKGFFIENFRSSTFFPVHYIDRSYAIVPQGLIEKQWMKVEDDSAAQTIEAAARASKGRFLSMTLLLTPLYADNKTPASIGGEAYWPLVVEVRRLMLYGTDPTTPLWQSVDGATTDEKHQSILNLYH